MPKKIRAMTADDLYGFKLISEPQISPVGDLAVYCEHEVDRKTQKKYAHLWAVSLPDGAPQQITHGKHSDTNPRFSPDGSAIAFLSNREDEKQPQIYLLPTDGGEARRLTDLAGEIGGFSFSPDGKSLLVQFRAKDKEEIEREKDEQKKKFGVVCREITRVFYKEDGRGYLPNERWHLWIVDVKTGKGCLLYTSPSPRDS